MNSNSIYDSIIIGGGPAGLAIANTFEKEKIHYIVLERKHIGYNISRFPVSMQFFSGRKLLEIDNFAMTIPEDKPNREQYMTYLYSFASHRNIKLADNIEVISLKKDNNLFEIYTHNIKGMHTTMKSKSVVVACGAFDNPQMLDVEGENLPHVSHYFRETYPYSGHEVMIIGSGNSAVETALKLYRSGCRVHFSFREEKLSEQKVKYWLYPDIQKRFEKGEIKYYPVTKVIKIDMDKVCLQDATGKQFYIKTDFVLALTGYNPPVQFLKNMNIEFHKKSNVPVHNPETLETNIEGLFVAGVLTGGALSGKVFIENSRDHGELISPRVLAICKSKN